MNNPVNHNERMVLGLDVGSNSIGWALVALENNEPSRFIDIGVRIFNKGVEDKIPTPKNQKRRQARLARRVIQRRARRKRKMESLLLRLELLPDTVKNADSRERTLNAIGDPYELRSKALDEALTAHELGRVFLHLVQRRGFLSNRKTAMGDLVDDPDVIALLNEEDEEVAKKTTSEEGQFLQQISLLRNAISSSGYRTLGEYLHKTKELPSKRNRIRNGGDLRTDRAMYLDELDLIWKEQSKHHELLNTETRQQLEEIIFYQRPLKLKADRIGKCSLEPRNKRCATARLEFQEFRYLQDLNNLRYMDPYTNKEVGLSQADIEKLLPLFEKQKEVSYARIRNVVGLDKSYIFTLEAAGNKKLKGNLTSIAIGSVVEGWEDYGSEKKSKLVEDLLTIKKKSVLRRRMQNHWGFSAKTAIDLCLLEFEEGHGNLSLKALRKLLPHMRNGLRYDEASVECGYGYEKVSSDLDKLPAPPVINNPIVSRGLNELRKLVNAIIKTYGKPEIIRVEMARDLEMNTKRYKQFVSRQNKNTKANEEAGKKWDDVRKTEPQLSLRKYPSRDDKIKYRLWQDQNMLCAYSCRPIGMTELFSSNVEVDHIVPFSFSLDDSYMNKVVCFAQENRTKSQKTPIDAYGNDESAWSQITGALDAWDKALYNKKRRFFLREHEIEKGFSNSQLVDTRYIAKEALGYLEKLGSDVTTTKGVMTSWVRHHWGLNSLLSDTDEKERSDHRHHAIDAVVTACIDRSFYQTLVKVARDIETSNSDLTMKDLHTDPPWENYRDDLKTLIDDLVISHQTSSKVEGSLNDDTGAGFIEGLGAVYRKAVDPKLNVKKVIDPEIKTILERHVKKHGTQKIAFGGEHPVFHKDGKTQIKRVRIVQSKTNRKDLERNKLGIKKSDGTVFKWHSYGNVHSATVSYDSEKDEFSAEYLTVAEAKRLSFARAKTEENGTKVKKFILHKNDAVRLNVEGEKKIYRVKKFEFTNRVITFIGNLLAKPVSKGDELTLTLSDENIRKYEIEKVALNVLGKVT